MQYRVRRYTTITATALAVTMLSATAAFAQGPENPVAPTAPTAPDEPATLTYGLDGAALVQRADGVERARLDLPCETPTKIFVSGGEVFVACQRSVVVVATSGESLEVTEAIQTPGVPKDVVRIDGEVFVGVEVVELRAEPLSKLRGQQQAAKPKAPDTPAKPPEGNEKPPVKTDGGTKTKEPTQAPVGAALSSKAGEVVVDLGLEDGVEVGDRIEFYVIEEVVIDAETTTQQERIITVAEVTAASKNRSKARLGLNIAVEPGALAREVNKSLPSRTLPPRASGLTEVSAVVRPFLAIGEIGGGAMTDIQVVHRFERSMAATLRMTPLVFGANRSGNGGSMALSGLLSYDTDLLQIGLGLGTSRITSVPFGQGDDIGDFVLTLGQTARLGSRDGLNIEGFNQRVVAAKKKGETISRTVQTGFDREVFNQFSLYAQEFRFESLHIHTQIPISSVLDNTWLIARGGGGALLLHGFGEVGCVAGG